MPFRIFFHPPRGWPHRTRRHWPGTIAVVIGVTWLSASATPGAAQSGREARSEARTRDAVHAAPRVSTPLSATDRAELEAVRKAVWTDWFGGDTAALRRVLTPELVAISTDAAHWKGLPETLRESATFRATGNTLVSVEFDSTTTHRFGDVVVMFSHYTVVTRARETDSAQHGLATEVFVRSGGRWVHTSWQLAERRE